MTYLEHRSDEVGATVHNGVPLQKATPAKGVTPAGGTPVPIVAARKRPPAATINSNVVRGQVTSPVAAAMLHSPSLYPSHKQLSQQQSQQQTPASTAKTTTSALPHQPSAATATAASAAPLAVPLATTAPAQLPATSARLTIPPNKKPIAQQLPTAAQQQLSLPRQTPPATLSSQSTAGLQQATKPKSSVPQMKKVPNTAHNSSTAVRPSSTLPSKLPAVAQHRRLPSCTPSRRPIAQNQSSATPRAAKAVKRAVTSAKRLAAAGQRQPVVLPHHSAILQKLPPSTPIAPHPIGVPQPPVGFVLQKTQTLAPRPVVAQNLQSALQPNTISSTAMANPQSLLPAPAMHTPSLSLQIVNVITEYLGPIPQVVDVSHPTLSALCDRLKAEPSTFDRDINVLSWNVREAIRTEFFKLPFPNPPSQQLLTLVLRTELMLSLPVSTPRPFFFPGARVTVPSKSGQRRVATSLQLRTKPSKDGILTEVMLHLDAPNGGAFQWVSSACLQPLSGLLVKAEPQTGRGATGRGGGGRSRGKGASGSRGGRGGRRGKGRGVSLVPDTIALSAIAQSNTAGMPPIPHPAGGFPVTQAGMGLSLPTSRTASSSARAVSSSSGRGSGSSVARNTSGTRGSASVRGSHAEITSVAVPSALVCASPFPQKRIIGEGRHVSFVSGSFRRAIDADAKADCSTGAVRVKNVLGVERLVARRLTEESGLEYFVKWSGGSIRDGSWEKRESLMEDVPGLVRDFDVRHPEESKMTRLDKRPNSIGNTEIRTPTLNEGNDSSAGQGTKVKREAMQVQLSMDGSTVPTVTTTESVENAKASASGGDKEKPLVEYVDDVSGVEIPSWVDTPIVEMKIADMVLQIRRPKEYTLHNDADAAARDTKKRQTEFKKKHVEAAVKVFRMSRGEARYAIEHGLRMHRENGQHAIRFPRGLGRVSPLDHGMAFSLQDAGVAPACWEGYFGHLGMKCKSYERDLVPYMPTLDDAALARVAKGRDETVLAMAIEHRERARSVVRDAFRYDGIRANAPTTLFREGVRGPPGISFVGKKRARLNVGTAGFEDVGFGREKLLRERDETIGKRVKTTKAEDTDLAKLDGMWYDSMWACWRKTKAPS